MRIVRPARSAEPKCCLARGGERLVRALEDPLGADVDPAARPSSGRTSSARAPRAGGTRPRSPSAARAASSRSARAARRACVRKTPTGLPLWTSSVSSSPSRSSVRTIAFSASWLRAALPGAAVDDQLLGMLGDLGVEVVEQHPQRRLGLPRARVQLASRAARGSRERSPQSASTVASTVAGRAHGSLRSAPRSAARACATSCTPVASDERRRSRDDRDRCTRRRRSARAITTTTRGRARA